MIVRGTGPPLVLVPGINGRWEWMRPTVNALAERLRVATFSYRGEPGAPPLPQGHADFDLFVQQVDTARASVGRRVAVCGVSYGGWVALRYAAQYPERVGALILVSTPPPPPDVPLGWRYEHYVRHPWLFAPAFFMRAFGRTVVELSSTFPSARERLPFLLRHGRAIILAPQSPTRSAQRWQLAQQVDLHADCRAVTVPTLLVMGEAEIDGVVPPKGTLSYLALVRGSNAATLPRTGHIGLITKPREFTRIVCEFLDTLDQESGIGNQESGIGNQESGLPAEARSQTETGPPSPKATAGNLRLDS